MKRLVLVGVLVGALGAAAASLQAAATMSQGKKAASTHSSMQAAGEVPTTAMRLGTVHIPRSVKADDQALKAGTYQSPNLEQWVEFLQAGKVKGKAVASIVPADQIAEVAKGPKPKINSARVDVLKGDEYVRVWINRGGNNYLIHLPTVS